MISEREPHQGKLTMITNKVKRINLKSKRKRTLIKKAIEVSTMCNLDMCIVIRDPDNGKIFTYQSTSETSGE